MPDLEASLSAAQCVLMLVLLALPDRAWCHTLYLFRSSFLFFFSPFLCTSTRSHLPCRKNKPHRFVRAGSAAVPVYRTQSVLISVRSYGELAAESSLARPADSPTYYSYYFDSPLNSTVSFRLNLKNTAEFSQSGFGRLFMRLCSMFTQFIKKQPFAGR